MSLTLGEKLRQAREERGISISEVAEQTRISAHYLANIEDDDYRSLPGGIFNKGFVKNYAKYVGIDEQEALQDYTSLITSQEGTADDDPKTYKPEVLTDDRTSGSTITTIIFAAIILGVLGLMAWGLITLVNYIQNNQSQSVANTNTNVNSNSANKAANTVANTNAAAPVAPQSEIKIEFKALSEPVSLEATVDGKKTNSTVAVATPQTFTGQQNVKLRYYRGFGDKVEITVNGKKITPPPAPAKGNGIEFEINKSNVVEIMQNGQISSALPNAANTNTAAPR